MFEEVPPCKVAPISTAKLIYLAYFYFAKNNLIIDDVLKAIAEKRSPLVLTKRKEHLQVLHSKLEGKVKNILVFQGGLSAKKIRQLSENLASIPPSVHMRMKMAGQTHENGRMPSI